MSRLNVSQIQFGHKLGDTSHSSVYACLEKGDIQKYVVKCFHTQDSNEVNRIIQDIVHTTIFQHPCLVSIVDYTVQKDDLDGWDVFIKMPRMERSLRGLMIERSSLSFNWIVRYFYSLACSLEHLERNNIAHCNLKPSNILFDREKRIYLSDLSMSRFKQNDKEMPGTVVNMNVQDSRLYMAPELFSPDFSGTDEAMFKADSWSLGMIILELCIGDIKPVPLLLSETEKENIIRGYLAKIGSLYEEDGKILSNIIWHLLQIDTAKRRTFGYARKTLQKWFSDVTGPYAKSHNYQQIFPGLLDDNELNEDEQLEIKDDNIHELLISKQKKPQKMNSKWQNKIQLQDFVVWLAIIVIFLLLYYFASPSSSQTDNPTDNRTLILPNKTKIIPNVTQIQPLEWSKSFNLTQIGKNFRIVPINYTEVESGLKDADLENLLDKILDYIHDRFSDRDILSRCSLWTDEGLEWYLGIDVKELVALGLTKVVCREVPKWEQFPNILVQRLLIQIARTARVKGIWDKQFEVIQKHSNFKIVPLDVIEFESGQGDSEYYNILKHIWRDIYSQGYDDLNGFETCLETKQGDIEWYLGNNRTHLSKLGLQDFNCKIVKQGGLNPKTLTQRMILQTAANFNRTKSLRQIIETIEAIEAKKTDPNKISEKVVDDWESYFEVIQLQKTIVIVPKSISEVQSEERTAAFSILMSDIEVFLNAKKADNDSLIKCTGLKREQWLVGYDVSEIDRLPLWNIKCESENGMKFQKVSSLG